MLSKEVMFCPGNALTTEFPPSHPPAPLEVYLPLHLYFQAGSIWLEAREKQGIKLRSVLAAPQESSAYDPVANHQSF